MSLAPIQQFPAWPPFFASGTASLQGALRGLEESEYWPAARVAAGQQAQLLLLLRWAAERVPYYRDAGWAATALERIGREPAAFWETWRALPVLTKATFRALGPQLNAPVLPRTHQPVSTLRTSGSTGIPVELGSTALTRFVWFAMVVRENRWRRRDYTKRLGFIRYYPKDHRDPKGREQPTWPRPIGKLYPSGPCGMIHVGHPVDVLADWLRRFDPHYLVAQPGITAPLMDEFEAAGIRPASLEEVSFVSEVLSPALEGRLRRQWGVRCCENYSSNETGYIAFRCIENESLHVQSENVLVEILDDAGNACRAGESGRVVVTPLHNLATPLIRYELGDYATAGEPCACGRRLPVIRQVLGRVRNLVRMPDGRRQWPVELAKFKSIMAIRQFQFVQPAIDSIELRLVLNQPLTPEEHGQVVQFARDALGYPFAVNVVPVDEIKRGPTGKFEEFLSLLPEA